MAKLWIACEAALVGGLALAVRSLPWRRVFDASSVHFAGNDAFYHARRIAVALGDFGAVPVRDPYLNFPFGGQPIWTPVFDALAARVARLFGASDIAAMERVIVWLPPAIAVVGVVAAWVVARHFFGVAAARVAAGLLVVIPAHFTYSQVGFVDHHVLVATSSLFLLAATLGTLRALDAQHPLYAPQWVIALGVALAACLALWPGMLLHVAVAEACLLALWIFARDGAARVAFSAAAVQAVALCVVAPLCLGNTWDRWGSFSPVVLSNFQPWLFGCGLFVFAALGLACNTAWGPVSAVKRFGLAIAAAAAALGGTFLLAPEVLSTVTSDAWEWFARTETFQADVSESRPIFVRGGRIAWLQPATLLTPLFYVFPFVLVGEWRAARSSQERSSRVVHFALLGWALALLAATLMQARFFNSFSIVMCLALGTGIVRWWAPPRTAVHGLGAAMALLLVVASCGSFYRDLLADPTTWGSPGEPALSAREQRRRMVADVGRWIAEHTPETSGWLDPTVRPEYAVMSPWTDGHILTYRGRRPNIASNFGDDIGSENFLISESFYLADDESASQALDNLGARYVLFEYRPIRRLRNFGPRSVLSRLYFSDGEAAEQAVIARDGSLRTVPVSTPALGRYRLVFETPPKPYSEKSTLPGFKLYQHVQGASVEGTAPPGESVSLRLDLRNSSGREWSFLAETRANVDGRYALRVPYPTSTDPGDVVALGDALVTGAGFDGRVKIDEAAVQQGLGVAGPDLTRGPIRDEGQRRSNPIPNEAMRLRPAL